ncbi:MAG: hybrid sensor histidine kinase/response regulator [Candidatus Riflebacteria bacterium]|nr:hybrid sensor histidine kinase/response regulator [Candidatus Riflebacteria bacterium]
MAQQTVEPGREPNILVVDDTPANLQLLTGMLKERGYRVRPVPSGRLALQAAGNNPPDLILLDINMPEMNGFEVCERLKATETLREIPVIFISALSEALDKVKAFSVGAVDYVTKPFHFEEVEARVATHLELCRKRRQLQQSYEKLRGLEELRDSLVHMIVHDLRSPLACIKGYLQILKDFDETALSADGRDCVQKALNGTNTLIEMVSSLLDVSKMEAGQMTLHRTECELASLTREVLARLEPLRGKREFSLEVGGEPLVTLADRELVLRVIQNLLSNALRFTPPDGKISVSLSTCEARMRVSVKDTGQGIPAEFHTKIFEKFGQVESRENRQKHTTGLGLTFCKLVVEAHGGRIGVESEVGRGSTFWFELPGQPVVARP